VDSVSVIVSDVIPDQTTQMSLVYDNQVIEKLSATASNPAFRDSILLRACRANACGLDAAGCQQIGYLPAKLGITIQAGVAVRTRFWKGFPQLLLYPGADWVFGDVEMEDLASTVFDHEKTIRDSERKSWHGEEVHGRNGLAVIAQESSPAFPCLLGRKQPVEIARNCAFRDVEAEFQKLAVNSGSAPAGILVRHLSDESSHLGIDLWPAQALWPRSKAERQPDARRQRFLV
jgi:hypothetical protein